MVNSMQMLWIDFEVNSNGFYQADTFRVSFPASGQHEDWDGKIDLSWWAQQTDMTVEIFAGFPADPDRFTIGDLDLLIEGRVDDLSIDMPRGVVHLSGRDFTGRLIDTKTTRKWKDQTSSAIATALAKAHGLTPKVTKTATKVGTYYEMDHAQLTNQRSEWDLLAYLAHVERFVVYVKGRELHFEPQSDGSNAYVLQWEKSGDGHPVSNAMNLGFSRNLTLSKDVTVKVHSWNQKHKKGFTKTARATHTKDKVLKRAASPVGEPQVYTYVIPNLTPEKALQKAQALLKSITAHEMKLTASLPADNILTPQTVLEVKGTGAYDQQYYPDSIIRRMSREGGYVMDITAKNHNVNSVVM